jgi:hypothetical protein
VVTVDQALGDAAREHVARECDDRGAGAASICSRHTRPRASARRIHLRSASAARACSSALSSGSPHQSRQPPGTPRTGLLKPDLRNKYHCPGMSPGSGAGRGWNREGRETAPLGKRSEPERTPRDDHDPFTRSRCPAAAKPLAPNIVSAKPHCKTHRAPAIQPGRDAFPWPNKHSTVEWSPEHNCGQNSRQTMKRERRFLVSRSNFPIIP